MNDVQSLEQQLEQLGHELEGTPDLPHRVMERLAEQSRVERPASRASISRRAARWQAPAALAASVMLCVGIWWLSRPTNLYAQMQAALAQAKTVHATGWTRQVLRKWPLEGPQPNTLAERWPEEKYPVEMWHWTDADGTKRSFERSGPVTFVRRGGDSKEYQEDADLTYVLEGGYVKDRVAEFGGMATYLAALERPSLTKQELGAREEGGRRVRGIRHSEGNRVEEIWVDAQTSLPVRITRKEKATGETVMEITFKVDEPVPASVASFSPPNTKLVRYAGGTRTNEAWLQHVSQIEDRLKAQPLAGRIANWPRNDGRLFRNQWPLATADGKYWVRPLDVDEHQQMKLSDFIRLRVATDSGDHRHGTWRVPKELHDIEMPRSDVVHAADMPWQEWVQFVLGQFNLEFVDLVESQKVWTAKHDGRALKPWQEVKPPVPYVIEGGKEQKGYVKPGIGFMLRPVTLQELFESFNQKIDERDFAADKPWIINATNLPAPPVYNATAHGTPREYSEKIKSQFRVATDAPWFVGKESIEMARQWYAKEFGITLTEETRPVTVHVIRRKQ